MIGSRYRKHCFDAQSIDQWLPVATQLPELRCHLVASFLSRTSTAVSADDDLAEQQHMKHTEGTDERMGLGISAGVVDDGVLRVCDRS